MSKTVYEFGEPLTVDINGAPVTIGRLDNSCDWGTLWQFWSARTNLIYVLGGPIKREIAVERAVWLDESLRKDNGD